MDDLFDIAHSDALQQMKNEDDKKFLILHQQKGRPGSVIGVDKEETTLKRSAMKSARKRRTCEEMKQQFDKNLTRTLGKEKRKKRSSNRKNDRPL